MKETQIRKQNNQLYAALFQSVLVCNLFVLIKCLLFYCKWNALLHQLHQIRFHLMEVKCKGSIFTNIISSLEFVIQATSVQPGKVRVGCN